jgi:hypothetical protein
VISPDLDTLLEEIARDEHTVLILFGDKGDDRVVHIMTPKLLDSDLQQRVRDLVSARLPRELAATMKLDVQFSIGTVGGC